jgi:hypothetical protein
MSKGKAHYAGYEAPHEGDNCEYWSDTYCGQDSENLTQYEDCVTCKNCLRIINKYKSNTTNNATTGKD